MPKFTLPKWSTSTTQSATDASNVTLEINEKSINSELKQVNLNIVLPRSAEVIVKNYAKNTANEALKSLSNIDDMN
jgi:spore coat polysaccharide biosynthesis predicted glycosyltransferase SpsG